MLKTKQINTINLITSRVYEPFAQWSFSAILFLWDRLNHMVVFVKACKLDDQDT